MKRGTEGQVQPTALGRPPVGASGCRAEESPAPGARTLPRSFSSTQNTFPPHGTSSAHPRFVLGDSAGKSCMVLGARHCSLTRLPIHGHPRFPRTRRSLELFSLITHDSQLWPLCWADALCPRAGDFLPLAAFCELAPPFPQRVHVHPHALSPGARRHQRPSLPPSEVRSRMRNTHCPIPTALAAGAGAVGRVPAAATSGHIPSPRHFPVARE